MALHSWRAAAVLGLLVALVITTRRPAGGVCTVGQLGAPQPRPRRHPVLHDGPDQPVQRRGARAALAVPVRHHRRRQQSDHARRRGRLDVSDRSARERLRARRRRRAPALELRRHQPDRRRAARGLRLPEPRPRVCGRRRVHGGGIVSVRARREDRQADPDVRTQRPGRCDHGRHPHAISRTSRRRSVSATGSRPLPRSTTASSTSAARAARATSPAVTCSPSTRRPVPCSGTSTRFRRTRTTRAGTSRGRPGSAANATAAGSGKRRRSIPSSA